MRGREILWVTLFGGDGDVVVVEFGQRECLDDVGKLAVLLRPGTEIKLAIWDREAGGDVAVWHFHLDARGRALIAAHKRRTEAAILARARGRAA